MARIAVIGAGHVGLVTAAVFAEKGHRVTAVDNDSQKIALLREGKVPFFEPGLSELLAKHRGKRLCFTSSIAEGVKTSETIFICVGTPPKRSGEADLSSVERVGREVGEHLKGYKVVVEKSTVPVETGKWLRRTIATHSRKQSFDVVCNPEFLREGSAVSDALFPERIVLGVEALRARKKMDALYRSFSCPKVYCDLQTAELIKHASNAFLSTKISFINLVALLCDRVGADVLKVAEGVGLDPRIGQAFLKAGIGFGGFCFPKDLQAFTHMGDAAGARFDLLKEVLKINARMQQEFVKKLKSKLWNLKGKAVAVWGLSFKPHTDDLRFSPALAIVQELLAEKAKVTAFDPSLREGDAQLPSSLKLAKRAYEAVEGAEALLLLTEWPHFVRADFAKVKEKMSPPYIVGDGRNALSPDKLRKLGFDYFGVGRS